QNARAGGNGDLSGAVTRWFCVAHSSLASHTPNVPSGTPRSGGVPVTRRATTPANGLRRLQPRPSRFALALVFALASLITLILLYIDRSISVKDKATQIG